MSDWFKENPGILVSDRDSRPISSLDTRKVYLRNVQRKVLM